MAQHQLQPVVTATPNCSPQDRGWMPSHDVRVLRMHLGFTLQRLDKQRGACRRERRLADRGLATADPGRQLRRTKRMRAHRRTCAQLARALHLHYMSYNKIYRPTPAFTAPPMYEPWSTLTEQAFMDTARFTREEFMEVVQKLVLIPGVVITKTRCRATKQLALYVVLRRWSGPESW